MDRGHPAHEGSTLVKNVGGMPTLLAPKTFPPCRLHMARHQCMDSAPARCFRVEFALFLS